MTAKRKPQTPEYQRAVYARRRDRALSQGMCTICARNEQPHGHRICQSCRDHRNARRAELRAQRKEVS